MVVIEKQYRQLDKKWKYESSNHDFSTSSIEGKLRTEEPNLRVRKPNFQRNIQRPMLLNFKLNSHCPIKQGFVYNTDRDISLLS